MTGYLDGPTPLPLAHRGGALLPGNEGIENTIAAFARAVELGYTYLETDVHRSADGVVYAFHDVDLSRLAGVPTPIGQADSQLVDAVRLGGREPIPRLDALLEAFPEARFNIDVKADDAVEATLDVLREHDALNRVCLASFSDTRLQRIRALEPGITTSFSPAEVARLRVGPTRRVQSFGVRRGGRCVQVPRRRGRITVVTPGFVRRAHLLELPVHVWTIDDPDEMRSLLDIGVDGIVTDRPDVLRSVLEERGQWKEQA